MDGSLWVEPAGLAGGLAIFWKGFSGFPFTWCNNRVGADCIQERLDRALATPSWRLRFSQACVEHLNSVGLDHFALLLHLKAIDHQKRVPFRFDARWVQDEEVLPIIEQAWEMPTQGPSVSGFNSRLKGVDLLFRFGRGARN
ncbi:hypothetical protein Vadar_021478 [Vaccinium darrowii]|uniref:Uncharacterized protein n=1 Tax=Vaccinium darrowii TaxID=229202 RepID=A0ACB7YFH5_9ERIC|nr:hypothetical protein Vadar_021478 [Vaccinium darrowii]